MKQVAWLLLALIIAPLRGVVSAEPSHHTSAPAVLRYLSPLDGAQFVPSGTTVALRLDGPIDPQTLAPALFSLVGAASGPHMGQVRLADDATTVIFRPSTPFRPGEHVLMTIGAGLATRAGAVFQGLHTGFSISAGGADPAAAAWAWAEDETPPAGAASNVPPAPAAAHAVAMHPQDYVTFPDAFPAYTVTVPATGTAPGLLFWTPINLFGSVNYLSIMDDSGEPVFWKAAVGVDFKKQPDGSLTYNDFSNFSFHVLDSTYSETRTLFAANGYQADLHELQFLPNGNALFMIYDSEITSTLQFGGYPTATVVGLVIQEIDPQDNPVFEWRSWDHFLISDTNQVLTDTRVDYVHGNALELDKDGNILLSSRHLDEITKIDHTTGDIIWRLGGKNNQFAITDPDGPFRCQHDIRRLPNGDLTIFDNHNPYSCAFGLASPFSRAVEYQIDENAKVVTNTWQYRNSPDEFGPFTGDNQRLPDGHRLIGWGFAYPSVTEVLTDGTKLFEMTLAPGYFSYRAFRFPWTAVPSWDPTLVLTPTLALTSTLYYSWNGATDVDHYEIYGGHSSTPLTLLGMQPRTGFENHTDLASLPAGYCAFRIRPIDHMGQPQRFSNVVYTPASECSTLFFFPAIFGP